MIYEKDLDYRLNKTKEYCKKHKKRRINNYMFDAINRYINNISNNMNEEYKLIDCIKFVYLNENCKKRYDTIIKKFDGIDENCKLLLTKAIYLEYLKKIENIII